MNCGNICVSRKHICDTDGGNKLATTADVKRLYEANSDTNVFNDNDKSLLKLIKTDILKNGKLEPTAVKVAYESNNDTNPFTDKDKSDLSKLLSSDDYSNSKLDTLFSTKVDKVAGKTLSSNDFTDTDKQKLDGLTNQTPIAGPKGDIGAVGPRGVKGDRGINGADGSKGNVGAKGPTGTQGLQGIQGLQGTKGNDGTNGINGVDGKNGTNGTGYADAAITKSGDLTLNAVAPNGTKTLVDLGKVTGKDGRGFNPLGEKDNSGSIASTPNSKQGDMWIAKDTGHGWISDGGNPATWTDMGMLRGGTGTIGAVGAKGDTGAKGSTGPTGATGPKGADSIVVGPKGSKGDQGFMGLRGPKGVDGKDSTVAGPKGDVGKTGPIGLQGLQGLQGPTGISINVLPPTPDAATRLATSTGWTPTDNGKSMVQIDTGDFWTYYNKGANNAANWVKGGKLVGPRGTKGDKGDIGSIAPADKAKLDNINITQNFDADKVLTDLSNKVDKVAGKGLSTNDYTDTAKTKVGHIAATKDVYLDHLTMTKDINLDEIPVDIAKKEDKLPVTTIDGQVLSTKADGTRSWTTLPDMTKYLTTDGKTLLDATYVPSVDQGVATKKYVDDHGGVFATQTEVSDTATTVDDKAVSPKTLQGWKDIGYRDNSPRTYSEQAGSTVSIAANAKGDIFLGAGAEADIIIGMATTGSISVGASAGNSIDVGPGAKGGVAIGGNASGGDVEMGSSASANIYIGWNCSQKLMIGSHTNGNNSTIVANGMSTTFPKIIEMVMYAEAKGWI